MDNANSLKLNSKFEPIIYLNEYDGNRRNIFLIHTGFTNADSYYRLVKKVGGNYNYIGINNHIIGDYLPKELMTMHNLANYYVQLLENNNIDLSHPIFIGWSLGGQIAFEIAGILEQRNISSLLILLDTVIPDEKISKLRRQLHKEQLALTAIQMFLKFLGYPEEEVSQIGPAMDYIINISSTWPKNFLSLSQVYVLKAMQTDDAMLDIIDLINSGNETHQILSDYEMKLTNSNIDQHAQNYITHRLNTSHFAIMYDETTHRLAKQILELDFQANRHLYR